MSCYLSSLTIIIYKYLFIGKNLFFIINLFLFKWRTWVVTWAVEQLLFTNIYLLYFFEKMIRRVKEWEHGSVLLLTHSFFLLLFICYLERAKSSKQFQSGFLFLFFILFYYPPFFNLFLFFFYYLIINYLIFIYLLFIIFRFLINYYYFLIVIF